MMAAALSLGTALPVLAEDHESRKNWQVTFDGSKMGSNVSAAEMAEEVSSIQPGDSIRLSIALKNSSSRATGWYMSNKVIETLEDDSSKASGGAYTYLLTYTDPQGADQDTESKRGGKCIYIRLCTCEHRSGYSSGGDAGNGHLNGHGTGAWGAHGRPDSRRQPRPPRQLRQQEQKTRRRLPRKQRLTKRRRNPLRRSGIRKSPWQTRT